MVPLSSFSFFQGCSGPHACLVPQSCLILCDPIDCSPPGSSVHGIFLVILFIFGCVGSLLLWGISSSCSAQIPHCRGFSCCGAQALGCADFSSCGNVLNSCGSRALDSGSIAVTHRFRCSAACGIFLDQGSNLCLLHWQMDSLSLSLQGRPCPWNFSGKEYWSGLPHLPPGDLSYLSIEPTSPVSPALQVDSLPAELLGKSHGGPWLDT